MGNLVWETDTGAVQRPLTQLWHHRWWILGISLGAAALAGLVVALTMPRGPATAVQALIVMASSLAVGLLAGLLMRSRWAMLLAPVAYIIAIELARLDAVGPTVDAIRLDNTFGILAFILGRGFHGLVGLLPMILGVEVGVLAARQLSGATTSGSRMKTVVRWIPTAVLALLVLALLLLILQPASTPPILGTDGEPLPGSIAELTTIDVNGSQQALMIRAYDADKPVLLYLSGGPGQSSLPWPRVLFDELSREFILVGWDQRGTGKSYAALDPDETLTLEQTIADTIAVTDYLRERFDEEKIYLLGESWGTTLAVLAAQQRPDLYHAIIGSGQMVSQRETDRLLYEDVLEYAASTGDEELAAQMRAFGEPPYADLYGYAFVMGQYEKLYKPYTPPQAFLEKGRAANLGPWNVLGSEYNLVEKVNVFRGFLDTASIVYPQLKSIDFRQDVPRLDVPLYVLDGAAELDARRDLALEWFNQVDAPIKRIFTFDNAAHAPAFEHFEAFTNIMTQTVLPETYTR
ncbi:MAG: alpha/beta fold hydrolase [Chloroflexi bacterium]|nr:alpha/beta fold hydrolase [Chloroflexota bacterium]